MSDDWNSDNADDDTLVLMESYRLPSLFARFSPLTGRRGRSVPDAKFGAFRVTLAQIEHVNLRSSLAKPKTSRRTKQTVLTQFTLE